MKIIIAGSRDITDFDIICKAIITSNAKEKITELVSGTARGVDALGEKWAEIYHIPIKKFPANWNKYGKSAGYRRNEEMSEYGDALLAIWDGSSKGTQHMIDIAKEKGLKVYVYKVS